MLLLLYLSVLFPVSGYCRDLQRTIRSTRSSVQADPELSTSFAGSTSSHSETKPTIITNHLKDEIKLWHTSVQNVENFAITENPRGKVSKRGDLEHLKSSSVSSSQVQHTSSKPHQLLRSKRSSKIRLCGDHLIHFLTSYCPVFQMSNPTTGDERYKRDVAQSFSEVRVQVASYRSRANRRGLSDTCCRQLCSFNQLIKFC